MIGSGHLTHNLRDWMMSREQTGRLAYAVEFQDWVHDQLAAHNLDALCAYRETSPQGLRAHPIPEHLLPLFVAWGAAGGDENAVLAERVFDGFEGAALAMDAYKFSRSGSQPPLTA